MSSTPPNEADTPPRGDVAEGGNPQPMKESEGRSLMSLKMRIASGGKNASRDQLDFVKTVDGVIRVRTVRSWGGGFHHLYYRRDRSLYWMLISIVSSIQ